MIDQRALVASDVELESDSEVQAFAIVGCDGSGPPFRAGPRLVVRSHAVLYRGSRVGAGFHAGHGALVREECTFGEDVSIGSHSVVEHHVTMADQVRLHSRCFVPEFSVLEEGAWLGPGVIVTNARYPNEPGTKDNLEGVRICAGARIGAGTVLLPGVVIGPGALVGAGAVVVRDVAAQSVVAGNPAKAIR